jgi:spermidine synthase
MPRAPVPHIAVLMAGYNGGKSWGGQSAASSLMDGGHVADAPLPTLRHRSCYKPEMIPWEKLDTARIPGTEDELRLMRRGKDFSIMLGTNELMNSRLSGSEAALATLAAKKIEKVAKPHMLVGGLGMGFTLRAALGALGSKAQIMVVELVPAVVAWAHGPMAEIFGDSLGDPRVSIREADVTEIIRAHRVKFDAILLDVDNGPEGLTRKANDALYSSAGLNAAHGALRAGGVLAVWSSGPNPVFAKRLRSSGFDVNEVNIRATGKGGGARHIIWIATKG